MTIRKITKNDKQIYTEMAKDFYSSPAVLENIPEENITSSFELFLAGTPWGDAFIFESEGRPSATAFLLTPTRRRRAAESSGLRRYILRKNSEATATARSS